jgi:hypothetical protein
VTVVELEQPRDLIPRWLGHGDLHVAVRAGHVYLRAEDVERLAGIPPWAHGETLLGDAWPLEIDGYPYYELEDAIARCESEATETAATFLQWLDTTLAQLLTDEALDLAAPTPGFIGSHPVRVAAQILDSDPAIRIGQNSLFAHMADQGWITRAQADNPAWREWQITPTARRRGVLTIRNVAIPSPGMKRRRTYPQIYITPAGMDELRRTLHALNPKPTLAGTHPTLFED